MESCSSNVTKLQICKLNQDYAQSFPSKPWPMIVNNSVRVLDIVEFNADANTMTIFVQLMAWWDDTELTLKSNDPDELVLIYLYLKSHKRKNAKTSKLRELAKCPFPSARVWPV